MRFLIISFLVIFLGFVGVIGCDSNSEIAEDSKEELDKAEEIVKDPKEELAEEVEEEIFIEIEETLIKVESNPEQGFYWDYYLFVPEMIISQEEKKYLLVGPNNTGTGSDSMSVHDESAYQEATNSQNSFQNMVSRGLGSPLLVPVFPRPYSEWWIYVQILDRNTMLMEKENLKRIDLQLIAMIEGAKKILTEEMEINMKEKIFINGFSASGGFSHRFTILHPHIVKAVASGGMAMPIFPIKELEGKKLNYSIGIADYEDITKREFDYDEYYQVHQYIYRDMDDDNDSVGNGDEFNREEERFILEIFGEPLERYKKAEIIYKEIGLENVEFNFYKGKGHVVDNDILNDVVSFFEKAGEM